jgi:type III secretion protein D
MELRILSGLHRGAVMEVDEDVGAITIGASPEADVDVLLADPGVAKVHCRLSPKGGRWHIEPVGGSSVVDRKGHPVKESVVIGRGQRFRLGKVWIGFFDANDPWDDAEPAAESAAEPKKQRARKQGYPRAKTSIIAAVLVAMAIPAAWFVSTAWGRAARSASAGPSAASEPGGAMVTETIATPRAAQRTVVPPAALAEEFTRALAERELRDRLELNLQPGHWEIRGSLDADEQQRFERLLMRFNETRKPTFPIKVTLVSPSEMLPFKVVEVITGKGASIVTDDGERMQVGDSHMGWRLSAVESGRVVFVGKQRLEIAL